MQADQTELDNMDGVGRGSEGIITAFVFSSPCWLLLLLLACGVSLRKAVVYVLSISLAAAAVWLARRFRSNSRS